MIISELIEKLSAAEAELSEATKLAKRCEGQVTYLKRELAQRLGVAGGTSRRAVVSTGTTAAVRAVAASGQPFRAADVVGCTNAGAVMCHMFKVGELERVEPGLYRLRRAAE